MTDLVVTLLEVILIAVTALPSAASRNRES